MRGERSRLRFSSRTAFLGSVARRKLTLLDAARLRREGRDVERAEVADPLKVGGQAASASGDVKARSRAFQREQVVGGPVVGVPSCSAVPGTPGHLAAYHLYRFDPGGRGVTVTAERRGLTPGRDGIADLGSLAL